MFVNNRVSVALKICFRTVQTYKAVASSVLNPERPPPTLVLDLIPAIAVMHDSPLHDALLLRMAVSNVTTLCVDDLRVS